MKVYRSGVHGDCSAMFFVGEVDADAIKLSNATKEALEAGISACKPGRPFSIIGKSIFLFYWGNSLYCIDDRK